MDPDRMDDYARRFQDAFVALWRKLGPELFQREKLDITGPQYFFLRIIEREGDLPASRLAEKMEVKPSAITVMIDRLIARGFVVREQDATDRRVARIRLTDRGRDVLQKVELIRRRAVERYLSDLEPEEQERFVATFEKLARKAYGRD